MRLKLSNWDVVMIEVPDEVTLALNLADCPNNCPGCHSPELRMPIGTELTYGILKELIDSNDGITCISFMGGDKFPEDINWLAQLVHTEYAGTIKTSWYSGKQDISSKIELRNFDYIKVGPYKSDLGPLNNPKTNQRMFMIDHKNNHNLVDITNKFWKK